MKDEIPFKVDIGIDGLSTVIAVGVYNEAVVGVDVPVVETVSDVVRRAARFILTVLYPQHGSLSPSPKLADGAEDAGESRCMSSAEEQRRPSL